MSSSQLPSRVHIQEDTEKVIEDCPPEIGEQLRKSAFDQTAANVFKKTREPLNGDQEYTVVKAVVDDHQLRLSVKDMVGVVDLTPSSKLQIDPKIGWKQILEMFLAVQRQRKSVEYHGIPIDDFLSDDVDIRDIFVVVAVNYLRSLDQIHKHGFIREFNTERLNAVDGRGRIDVEQSLLNIERGIPKQHFVQKNIDYSTSINSLIHYAGKVLLRLFQEESEEFEHHQYYRIFSGVREEVRRMERMGINSSYEELPLYRRIDTNSLPRQRGYYRRALRIAKIIASTTTGQSLESAKEDLTVDYILNMASLFEKFTQVVLEKQLEGLQSNPLYGGLEDIEVVDKPSLDVYDDRSTVSYQPDHVLQRDSDTIAVLDSKYYREYNDPSTLHDERSRMFSYAYHLETKRMAFFCPFGKSKTRPLKERDGSVRVVRPDGEFTIDTYQKTIREYLKSTLSDHITASGPLNEISEYPLAHHGSNATTVEEVLNSEELRIPENNFVHLSEMILKGATDADSSTVNSLRDAPNRFDLFRNIKGLLSDHSEYDICLPLFCDQESDEEVNVGDVDRWPGDKLKIYFLKESNGEIEDITSPHICPLQWRDDRKWN